MDLIFEFKEYLQHQAKPASKVTVKNYLADVRKFTLWVERRLGSSFSPEIVTPQLIEEFKQSNSGAASSIERNISSLRKFFHFLVLEGILNQSPFDQNKLQKTLVEHDPFRLKDFKNYLYVYNASPLTIKNYLVDIKSFANWLEKVTTDKNSWEVKKGNILSKVDSKIIEEYKLRTMEISAPRTVNRKLSSLRKYFRWAENEGIIKARGGEVEGTENLRVRLQTKWTGVETARKEGPKVFSYSSFPPLRVTQKTFHALEFAFELITVSPLAFGLKKLELLSWRIKGKPVFESVKSKSKKVKNLPKELFAPLDISTNSLPLHKKLIHHLRYTRPKWYLTYHRYSFTHYLHLGVLVLAVSLIGFNLYLNYLQKPLNSNVLGVTNPKSPPRILSFQGRLTDASDNPITATTDLRFGIYDSLTGTGSALLWQEVQNVTPDADGVFAVLLGTKSTFQQNMFAEHAGLWLGVTVGTTAELTPRQQLATVAYAENAETLQGLPPITDPGAGTNNVVLALDSSGNLTIGGTATPKFQATGGKFTLSGNVLTLTTLSSSNSNIELNPDGRGFIDLQKPLQNTTNNNNISTALGALEVNDLFAILATSSGQSAFTVDQNGAGPIISASSSGTARFTVDNSGNTTISGNFLSALTASRDLGSSSVRWNNLWVQTINATGTNTSGQASFTYDPADTTYAQATVLINPTSAGSNELLLGAGIGGVERASIDTEGDLVVGFAGGTVTRNSNPLTVYNHGTTQVASIDTSGSLTLSGSLTTTSSAPGIVVGTNPASAGAFRIANNLGFFFRNAANTANVEFGGVNASDQVQLGGNALIIESDGDIGIGTTTSLLGKVNIQSADSGVSTVSGASDELVIEGSGNAGISILTPNTANAQISFGDPQDNNVGNINYLHSENRMQFRTAGLSTGLDIDSSGEVGIGTTTPGNKLEVSNTDDAATVALIRGSNTGTSVGIYKQFAILNQNTSINTQTGLALQHYNASSAIKDAATINASLSTVTAGSEEGYLTFSTIRTGSSTEAMRITSGGKVGINTTDLSGNNQLRVVQSTSGTIAAGKFENGALSAVNLAVGNGYGMSIVCEESNSIYCFQAGVGTGNITTMYGGGGWTIGNAATNQGAGTINVTGNIYKNGSAYNNPDYAFEKYFTGKIVQFADREGASDYPGLMPLEEVENYAKTNYQLPRVANKRGIFDRTDILLEKVEEIYLYLFDFNRRILSLESKTCVQSESNSEFGLIKSLCSKSTIEKVADSGTYAVKNAAGEAITGGQILAEAVIGILRTGLIETKDLIAENITVESKVISPVAEIKEIQTDTIAPLSSDKVVIRLEDNSATPSATSEPKLEIQNASGSAVTTIDDQGNVYTEGDLAARSATFSGTLNSFGLISESASISGTLRTKNLIADNIESQVAGIKTLLSSLTIEQATSSASIDIASYSAELANVDTLQAQVGTFVQGLFAVGPTSLSDATVFGQFSVGGNLILADASINVLGQDLQIQPLAQGGVSFLAGKVQIDTSGNLTIEGNTTVKGTLFTNVIAPIPGSNVIEFKTATGSAIATIDNEGTATFKKLNLSLIEPAFALSETEFVATGSAGIATISAQQNQLTILNKLVTEKSLIYLTPVGTTSAQTPYLLRQEPGDSFTVGGSENATFNWLIIN